LPVKLSTCLLVSAFLLLIYVEVFDLWTLIATLFFSLLCNLT